MHRELKKKHVSLVSVTFQTVIRDIPRINHHSPLCSPRNMEMSAVFFIFLNLLLCIYLLQNCAETSLQDGLQNEVVKNTANKYKMHMGEERASDLTRLFEIPSVLRARFSINGAHVQQL